MIAARGTEELAAPAENVLDGFALGRELNIDAEGLAPENSEELAALRISEELTAPEKLDMYADAMKLDGYDDELKAARVAKELAAVEGAALER